jgi:4-hydroxy-2-oxoheptanedioate aldolase
VQNGKILPSLTIMRANTFKETLLKGRPTTCGWLGIPSIYSAELAGHAGFDTVLVDLQHGMIDFQMALNMLTAISSTPATPMVRSTSLDPAQIMHLLDAGAYGVVCPMISTPAQAATFVSACRYPPRGDRSYGPARGFTFGGPDYYQHADSHVMTWAMIETQEGVANLDAILKTDGLDGIFIGPNDLSLALVNKPGQDFSDPKVIDAIAHILARAKAAGKFAGIYSANGETGAKRIAQGFQMVTLGNDAAQLNNVMKDYIAKAMSAAPSVASKTGY